MQNKCPLAADVKSTVNDLEYCTERVLDKVQKLENLCCDIKHARINSLQAYKTLRAQAAHLLTLTQALQKQSATALQDVEALAVYCELQHKARPMAQAKHTNFVI